MSHECFKFRGKNENFLLVDFDCNYDTCFYSHGLPHNLSYGYNYL